MLYSCGVDPGLSGALALLHKDENKTAQCVEVKLMPKWENAFKNNKPELNEEELVLTLEKWLQQANGRLIVVIEEQQAMHSQGVVSTFTTGSNAGIIRGVCSGLKIPYKLIKPKVWQDAYPDVEISKEIQKLNIKDSKKKSLSICTSLFPNVDLKTKRGKYLDAISDAVLIGNFGLL